MKGFGGYVYVLGDFTKVNIYKIGVTRGNVEKRIKKLQTGNSGEIFLCMKHWTKYPFFIERKLHRKFSENRIMNEWFILETEDVNQIKDIIRKEEELIEIMKDNPFFVKQLK